MQNKQCSFCSQEESDVNVLIHGGYNTYICGNCIVSGYMILFGDVKPSEINMGSTEDEVDFLETLRK